MQSCHILLLVEVHWCYRNAYKKELLSPVANPYCNHQIVAVFSEPNKQQNLNIGLSEIDNLQDIFCFYAFATKYFLLDIIG